MEEKQKVKKIETKEVKLAKTTTEKNKKKSPTQKKKFSDIKKSKIEKKDEIKNIKISGLNNLALNTYVLDDVKNPKAVVLVIHGMMEHILRYTEFAKMLNKNGYIVVMSDLRGHGKTAPSIERLGYGEKDIFKETLQDLLNILSYINENYSLPIYAFGHSYGSMLLQNLIQRTPLIEKAIICGTTNGDSLAIKLGSALTKFLAPFKDQDKTGGIIEKLCIESYGKKFKNGNWLTKDESVFEKYQQDEYCGGSFPFSFYRSMVQSMAKANDGINKIGKKKLFLICGEKDPVGEFSKQVKKLYKIYLKHNIDVKLKIYPNDRHELLNEIDKNEVYDDIIKFFD